MSKLRINELESLETGRSLKVDEMAQTFDYKAGIKITSYNQMVRDDDGEFWRVSGQVVLPYVSTGSGLPEGDALVPAGDAVLRQELKSADGSVEVGFSQGIATSTQRTVQSKLSEIVSVADFGGSTDSERFENAITYLVDKFNGGTVFVPPGTWIASIDVPSSIQLVGAGVSSIIMGEIVGKGSYVIKISNAEIGEEPTGLPPVKDVRIHNLVVNANGADFGVYVAGCLFPELSSIKVIRAKVRNLFMAATYTYSIDTVELSACVDAGGSLGENLFSWSEDNYGCNAGNSRRLFCYGNGTGGTYNKSTAPMSGAGLIVGLGIGNTFTSYQGEANSGVGLYVLPRSSTSFYGIYLELNGRGDTADFYQVVNSSSTASFYDVHPHYLVSDVFYAQSRTTIFGYSGILIRGPGPVSLSGSIENVTTNNPLLQTIPIVERRDVDTGTGNVRLNVLKFAQGATEGFKKSGVYESGVYVVFKSSVTVGAGESAKSLGVYSVAGALLTTLVIPPAAYSSGDVIYVRFLTEDIESHEVLEIGFGGGANIGSVDLGVYVKLTV